MEEQESSTKEIQHDEGHDQPIWKRKHCENGNFSTPKRNDAQDQPVIKRKYEIDYEDFEKIMKEETDEFDRKIALGEANSLYLLLLSNLGYSF